MSMPNNKYITIRETQIEEGGVSFVFDEEHYTEVFQRMTEVEQSLKIAT